MREGLATKSKLLQGDLIPEQKALPPEKYGTLPNGNQERGLGYQNENFEKGWRGKQERAYGLRG